MNFILREKKDSTNWGARYLGVNSENPNASRPPVILGLPFRTKACPEMSILAFDSREDAEDFSNQVNFGVNVAIITKAEFERTMDELRKHKTFKNAATKVLPAEMFVKIQTTGIDI